MPPRRHCRIPFNRRLLGLGGPLLLLASAVAIVSYRYCVPRVAMPTLRSMSMLSGPSTRVAARRIGILHFGYYRMWLYICWPVVPRMDKPMEYATLCGCLRSISTPKWTFKLGMAD